MKTAFGPLFFIFLATACSFDYDTVSQNDNEPNLVMEKAEYVRIENGNPVIRVRAEEVRRYEAKHTMELDTFSFEQYNAAPENHEAIPDVNAWGNAGKAQMETDTGNVFLSGGVVIEVVSEDITMETAELSWQDQERLISAPGRIHITRSDGTTLKGTGFSADVRERSWEFESAVEGSVVEE
jgi:LPS export ABC transporter protein LptC